MNSLIKYFPRTVGNPYRTIVYTKEEMFKNVNSWNCRKNVYYSLYDTTNYNLDKVAYDLDSDKSLDNMNILHKSFCNMNIKHLMLFSGSGFHFYFFTKNYKGIKNLKDCLRNVQIHYLDKLCLSYDDDYSDVDRMLIGDINRIIRVPNTFNKKAGLYCIPVTREDLGRGLKYIKNKAKSQTFKFTYYGINFVDLWPFKALNLKENNFNVYNLGNKVKYIKFARFSDFAPCIQNVLKNPELAKNHWRFYFAKYCCDRLIDPDVCDDIARKYWSDTMDSTGRKTKYQEFVEEKQIEYAYGNSQTFFPDCDYIKRINMCPHECDKKPYR